MLSIEINLPSGDAQTLFLDHLNSQLDPLLLQSEGSASHLPDGSFVSTVTGIFEINASEVELVWQYYRSASGVLTHIEVNAARTGEHGAAWESTANKLVINALTGTAANLGKVFFRRTIFNYIGTPLNGEYWFGKLRFGPVSPPGEHPFLDGAEQVVAFDQEVRAIDADDAFALGEATSARMAARLSFVLEVGMYRPSNDFRWVLKRSDDGETSNERLQLNFLAPIQNSLPKKGELCALGEGRGQMTQFKHFSELLSVPKMTRALFRAIDADPRLADAFDRSTRLYQVALRTEHHLPSVSLAYRVAAVEALSKADPEVNGFSQFMRKYAPAKRAAEIDRLLEFLHSTARSAHFHAGAFPLGEFDKPDIRGVFLSEPRVFSMTHKLNGMRVTREAMDSFLLQRIPANRNAAGDS